MPYVVFLFSILFVMGFVGFSTKPSPIYGGLGLIVSGGLGCGIIVGLGGLFLGLMVFLIYLGGMLVVFGYTTAMATEEYPEIWGSNVVIWGSLVMGVVMELMVVAWMSWCGTDLVVSLSGLEVWAVFDNSKSELVREDSLGVASIYDYGYWLMVMAGWILFISIFIVIEITRGG
uniref:NADH-ubiquinone oxidoreductase chain 6 n=1 Tax=Tupaia montana TaxID=1035795 RepID=A0A873HUY2_9EUTH|nr:NADH dehydrogenase subunit 6 [Tupaia montana]QOZ41310.1 NADH dehydrogenase subunit 6 [Tupaia montana]QOZ41323.1 NADH dehydrogenase subunit 6 [Tupaia montana]QOZ41336.1 NADH dehydrogenase subunit 6 [Tupaia montana]QOZ41349.1 NADH dehydrogenase subunit 6 [Tupaia montana]